MAKNKSDKTLSITITIISIIFVTFHLYTGYFGSLEVIKQRGIHLLLGLLLLYLIVLKDSKKKSDKFISSAAIIATIASIGYIFVRFNWIAVERFPYVTPLSALEKVLGVLLLILVLDSVRRKVGNVMVYVVAFFLAYPFIGPKLPGVLQTRQIVWTDIIDMLYLTTNGIFGMTLGVSATVLALFIIFGAFISSTGTGNLLYDLSTAAVGKSRGGPAKIAVFASALMGSINGSPAANVVTTGALTIPMMKKLGYKKDFAGAVEACASTGGQFLPPVMGAGAFIMVVFTGIPYVEIMKYALIPAILFLVSVFVTVHLEALKLNLPTMASEKKVKDVLKEYGHMFFPIAVLVVMLIKGYSPAMSGSIATVLLVITSYLRKKTRPSFAELIDAVETGAKGILIVLTATAAAGIVIGIINYTGIGDRVASAIIAIGQGNLYLVLILVAIISIIMGMGMPPVPSYVIQAGLTIPALLDLGVPVHAAHLFVFYFCGLSLITPPVAVASFAAAGLSGGSPMKTGWEAFRMAIPSFIIPFVFALNPALLMDGAIGDIIAVTITAFFGVFAMAVCLEGFFLRSLSTIERLITFAAAILLILPFYSTILPGFLLLALTLGKQILQNRKSDNLTA